MEINNPHDKFFKETFSKQENVVDFIQGTFPENILDNLELSSLVLDNNSYIDEELKEYFSDIVYNCISKTGEVKIAILFEHKSYVLKYPHLQLLKYQLKVLETNIKQNEKLILAIPVIIYHGKEKWEIRKFEDYFEGLDVLYHRFIPSFDYLLTDLSAYSNEEIKEKAFQKVSLAIPLLLMKNIFDETELTKNIKGILEIGKNYLEQEEGLKFLEGVIRYLSAAEIEPEKVINTIKEISEEGGELLMTMASRLIERGMEKGRIEGIERGMEKGRIEGVKEAIELGLELKYGVEGLKVYEKVVNITSIDKLEMIKEAIKTSKNLEEIEIS